ncbi:hypothetical protein ACGF0J_22120 [Nonomuraea sp. NPDC047897]|uniref:hypothetical protein n=1 Tax=Nonomuraea sp. NPDC047897 TaxID=3364346 RepID=UPI0037196D84
MTTGQHIASRDRAARQLSVLSATYPGWEIQHNGDAPAEEAWKAVLLHPLTPMLAKVGVEQTITRPDAPSLASALQCQVALIHNERATHEITKFPGRR